jgi:hypothetical protein
MRVADLNDTLSFVRVVDARSFTAATRALRGLTPLRSAGLSQNFTGIYHSLHRRQ